MTNTVPDWLDWRASNARLIAEARARIAAGHRSSLRAEELMRQSAKLMPPSAFELLTRPPRLRERLNEAWADQLRSEQTRTAELRQIGCSLRSYVNEVIVGSQETRWQARQSRTRAEALRERSQWLRRAVRSNYCNDT